MRGDFVRILTNRKRAVKQYTALLSTEGDAGFTPVRDRAHRDFATLVRCTENMVLAVHTVMETAGRGSSKPGLAVKSLTVDAHTHKCCRSRGNKICEVLCIAHRASGTLHRAIAHGSSRHRRIGHRVAAHRLLPIGSRCYSVVCGKRSTAAAAPRCRHRLQLPAQRSFNYVRGIRAADRERNGPHGRSRSPRNYAGRCRQRGGPSNRDLMVAPHIASRSRSGTGPEDSPPGRNGPETAPSAGRSDLAKRLTRPCSSRCSRPIRLAPPRRRRLLPQPLAATPPGLRRAPDQVTPSAA